MEKKRSGSPESWVENWTEQDFRNKDKKFPGWITTAIKKFKAARNPWRARNPGWEEDSMPEETSTAVPEVDVKKEPADPNSNTIENLSTGNQTTPASKIQTSNIPLRPATTYANASSSAAITPNDDDDKSIQKQLSTDQTVATAGASNSSSNTQSSW